MGEVIKLRAKQAPVLKEESDKLLNKYIDECNAIIMNLPKEIQSGLNELISYIIKRSK